MQIEFDTSDVVKGQKEVETAFAKIVKASKSLESGVSSNFTKMKEAMKGLRGPTPTTLTAFAEFAKTLKKYDNLNTNFTKLAKDLNSFANIKAPSAATIKNIERLLQVLQQARPNSALAQTSSFLRALGGAANGAVPGFTALVNALNRQGTAHQAVNQLINQGTQVQQRHNMALNGGLPILAKYGSSLGVVQRYVLGTSVAFQGLMGVLGFREVIQANIALDKIQAALLAVSTSAAASVSNFQFVRNEAMRLGIDLETAARGYTQLLAASKETTLSTQDVQKLFSQTSEAVRTLGLSAVDAEGVFRAFTQIISKGSLQAEELRGQLGDRIPGAVQMFAKAMGVTTEQLGEMMKKGQVHGDLLFDSLKKFGDELQKMAAGGLPTAINSMQAAFGRLQLSVMEAFREIGKGGFNEAMRDLATGLSTLLQSTGAKDFFKDIGAGAKTAADNIGLFAGALVGLVTSAAFIGLVAILSTLGASVGGVVTVLGVLAGVMAGYYLQSSMEAAAQTKAVNDELQAVKATTEALAKGDFQKVADNYDKVTAAIKRYGDQIEATARIEVAAEARRRAAAENMSSAGGMSFSGEDRAGEIAAEVQQKQLEDLKTQLSGVNELVRQTTEIINSGYESVGNLGERFVALSEALKKTDGQLSEYYAKTAQLQTVTMDLSQAQKALAGAHAAADIALQNYMRASSGSLEEHRAAFEIYQRSVAEVDRLSQAVNTLAGTKSALENWLQSGAQKFGILLNIVNSLRGGIEAINRSKFGTIQEAPANSNDENRGGPGLTELNRRAIDAFGEVATTKKTQHAAAVKKVEEAYTKAVKAMKSASEEELKILKDMKDQKLAELAENYKKAGREGASAFDSMNSRSLDAIRSIIQVGEEGERSFATIDEGGRKLSETEKSLLTDTKNLEIAFRALSKSTNAFETVAESINAMGGSKSANVVVKLGEAHRNLEKDIKIVQARMASGTLKGKDYDDAMKFIEKSTAAAGTATELYDKALYELQKELDKTGKQLKDSVQDAELENELLYARIIGTDDLSEKVARLTSERAVERTELEKKTVLQKLHNELEENSNRLYEIGIKHSGDMSDALRLEVSTLLARNSAIGSSIREFDAYYDRLIEARRAQPFLERNAKLAEEARDAWSKPFEEAGKNIYNSFADTFENILDGGTNTFEDFAKDILGIFKKLAAQIAALLIFQPVVGGILSGLGFSSEFQRKLGILPSGDIMSGANSFFGSGIGDVFSGGKSLLSNFFGGGTSATGWSWLDNTLNAPLWGSASPQGFAESGVAIGEISGLGGTSGYGGVSGMTVGGAIGGAAASIGSIYGAVTNPNIASIGGAIVTTGTTILSALGMLSSTMGPIGMAIGAVLSLVGSFIKKKPSNKGAEYSFNLDEGFTTQFEGTKHPEQMAYVKSFAEPIQKTIMALETRYGVVRAADATIGANFGIKEGSSFFYDRGDRDGGIENRQIFKFDQNDEADIQRALDELMVAMLRDADWSGIGQRLGEQAGKDVAIALENSAATTLEELLSDIDFASNFEDLVQLGADDLDPIALALRKIGQEGKNMAAGIQGSVDEFRDRAESLGLGTELLENGLTRADQATQGYILSLLGLEAPLDDVTSATQRANSFIADLTPILEQAGFSMEQIGHITSTVFDNMVAEAEAMAAEVQRALAEAKININTAIQSAINPNYQMPASDLFTSLGLDYSYSGSAGGFGRLYALVNSSLLGSQSALIQVGERLTYNLEQGFLTQSQVDSILNFATSGFERYWDRMNSGSNGDGGDTTGGGGDGGDGGDDGSDNSADEELRRSLNEQIDTLRELASIQQEAATNAQRLADAFKDSANSLRLYRLGLLVDPSKSPLSLEDQLAEAQRQQLDAFQRVMAGGEDAVDASKELQSSTDKVISLSQLVYGSSKQSGDIFRDSMQMLEQAELKSINYAEQQLAAAEVANLELKRINDQIEVLQNQLSSIGSGGGGSTPPSGGGSTPPGGGTTNPPAGYYKNSAGQLVQIKFGMQSLGRGVNEDIQSFMSRSFLSYTGPMTEEAAHTWMLEQHPSNMPGLSRLEYFAAARRAGFPLNIPFGSGLHEAWLNEDTTKTRWKAFLEKLREYTVIDDPTKYFGQVVAGMANGGLVTGGISGRDSVPIMAMPGERIFSVDHSRMLEQLSEAAPNMAVVQALGDMSLMLEAMLSGVQARLEMVEYAVEKQTVEQVKSNDGMRRVLNSRGEVGESGGKTARRRRLIPA